MSGAYFDYTTEPRVAYQSSFFLEQADLVKPTRAVNGRIDDDYNVDGIQATGEPVSASWLGSVSEVVLRSHWLHCVSPQSPMADRDRPLLLSHRCT